MYRRKTKFPSDGNRCRSELWTEPKVAWTDPELNFLETWTDPEPNSTNTWTELELNPKKHELNLNWTATANLTGSWSFDEPAHDLTDLSDEPVHQLDNQIYKRRTVHLDLV